MCLWTIQTSVSFTLAVLKNCICDFWATLGETKSTPLPLRSMTKYSVAVGWLKGAREIARKKIVLFIRVLSRRLSFIVVDDSIRMQSITKTVFRRVYSRLFTRGSTPVAADLHAVVRTGSYLHGRGKRPIEKWRLFVTSEENCTGKLSAPLVNSVWPTDFIYTIVGKCTGIALRLGTVKFL